jgi:hypothetical protein
MEVSIRPVPMTIAERRVGRWVRFILDLNCFRSGYSAGFAPTAEDERTGEDCRSGSALCGGSEVRSFRSNQRFEGVAG